MEATKRNMLPNGYSFFFPPSGQKVNFITGFLATVLWTPTSGVHFPWHCCQSFSLLTLGLRSLSSHGWLGALWKTFFPTSNMFPHYLPNVCYSGVTHSFAARSGKICIYNTLRFFPRYSLPLPPSLGLCSCLQYKHRACLAAGLENTSLLFWPKLFGQGIAAFVISSFAFHAHKTSQFQWG